MWKRIKELNEQRGQILADMKKMLTASETEKRDLTAEENTKFDDLHKRAESFKVQIDQHQRVHDVEQAAAAFNGNGSQNGNERRQQPGRENTGTEEQATEKRAQEQRKQLDQYLRTGTVDANQETRALTVSGAGVVGDRPFYGQLVTAMKAYAGVRQAGAMILPTTDGNPLTIPTMSDVSNKGRLVGEGTTNNNATDSTLGNITLGGYKFDSDWIKLSIELLQDAGFPVEATILAQAGERIGRAFNIYSTTGTGSGQPKGFVTAGGVGKTLASVNALTYDELIDFVHSLDAAYRNTGKAQVQLHDTTLSSIRKLKDGNGRYIWSAGETGQPSRILDYGYTVNNDMGQLADGAGTVVAAFGDFSRYFVRDVTQTAIIRADELFAADGLVGYKIFQRMDSNLADTSAVKLLKTAAS
jgi:HK97 family phage major capsid protein